VTGDRVPVLWIAGPSGVGKSTVSWQLFTELAGSGARVAFADADQLCICYPAPSGDPGRDRFRARNAGAVIANFRAAGARCVIVNGVVDPDLGVQTDLLGQAAVAACRLRADPEEVVRRLRGRERRGDGDPGDPVRWEDTVRKMRDDCERMDASGFADACVDTTGVSAAEVARLVRDSCRDWPGFGAAALEGPDAPPPGLASPAGVAAERADGQVLLLCGPTGVGKSTIGFQLYLRTLGAGLTAGYIDLDQIGFLAPASASDSANSDSANSDSANSDPANSDPGRHRLKAANLAAIWRTYHAAGARHLVLAGPVENQAALAAYLAALPAAAVTVCRLHAGPAELRRRIITRGAGGSWPQPGDPLRGQPPGFLARVAERAAADAQALDRAGLGAIRIDTGGHTAAEAADLIAAAARWPGR
jgi:adenylylsulfate kinase-like enzyme